MELFCRDWNSAAHAVEAAFRMRGIISPEIMFYRQWSNRGATDRIYKRPLSISDVDPLVPGYVDLPGFLEGVFFTNMGIRGQFEDVNFAGSVSLETRLLKLFTQEDLRVSLFNATNMKTLFELSALVNVDNFTGQYEVFRLQPLVDEMNGQVSTKELFVVYSFLRNLIENTFLQSNTPHNSTFDKTMMAFTLTDVIRNEFTRFRANFTSRMIAAGAIRFLQLDDCRTSFVRLFPRERASTFCNIPKFDITTMEGARFWWRLYIGRRPQDIALLESETPATLADFEKYFDDDYSDFTLFTQSMLDGIEISFHQMMSGIITLNPPPILRGMTAADNFVTFFGLEDTQLISPEFNFLGKFQDFELDPEVDVTYRHVIQGMRDSRLFNPFFILKILNDQCSEVERFCTENFRIWLTFLYRNRGLPPLIRRLTVKEILNGTYSPHLLDIQRKNPQYGGDPTIRTDFNVLPHNGVPETTLRMNVFSGDVNPDRARNLLKFDSEKEYITAERTFYHVDRNPLRTGVQEFEVNPWTQEVWFAGGTDGFQFNPDMTRRDDLIFYADYFKAMIKVDFQSVINAFGLKAFIFETPISIYQRITEGEIGGITLDGQNPYHNFHFYDMFNASAVFRSSYFVTEPMFSRLGGANVRELSSEIIDRNGDSITGQAHWNDRILCEPWSGLIIRGDTGFQMNFFYDSYTPEEYHQYLMPYVLYNKRLDIDGALARDLFHDITIIDERMRLVFILSMIIGGILASSGGSLLALTIFRNRQRSKILKEIREEESERKRLKMQNRMNGNQSRDTGADTRINGSLLQE